MVRSTVAHVDLAALRPTTGPSRRCSRPGPRRRAARPPSSPSSRRTRTGTARATWPSPWSRPGRRRWRARTSKRGWCCGAGVEGRILVFGALSVSDLEGLFEYDLTPDLFDAGRGARAAGGRGGARPAPAVPPQDRHRAEPAGLPARQPGTDTAGTVRQRQPGPGGRLDALRDGGRPRASALRFAARALRCRAGADREHGHAGAGPSRREQRGPAARPARLVRRRPAGDPAVRRAAARRSCERCRSGRCCRFGAASSPSSTCGPARASATGRFSPATPRVIATVPAGYADGLDTRLGGRGHVLVCGRRAPIVGAVSMDMLAIDVTGMPVNPGDEVVFLGDQGPERITASEMAGAIGTIPYEILCRIGSRIERVYDEAWSARADRSASARPALEPR